MHSTKSILSLIKVLFVVALLFSPALVFPALAQEQNQDQTQDQLIEAEQPEAAGQPDQPAPLEQPAAEPQILTPTALAAPFIPTEQMRPGPNGLQLAPFLNMQLDAQGRKSVVDMLLPENAELFAPYDQATALAKPGTLWLRFTSDQLPGEVWSGLNTDRNVLDLGLQVPGQARVWLVRGDEGLPIQVESGRNNLFQLPDPSSAYQVLIRIDGQPGLWFAPVLSTMAEATSSLYRLAHWLCLGALAVLCLLGLVRGISERGDGRIWTGIFCGGAFLQAYWSLPATPHGTVLASSMPGVLGAAIALLFLPHVGRQITRSGSRWGFADTMFLLLALVGAAAVLLPLMPGFAFTSPYVSLWPLGAALALLPSLFLLLRGTRGSGLFALACLLMIVGALAGYAMIERASHNQLLAELPLLGVVAGSLLLAVTVPRHALTRPAPLKVEPGTDNAPATALLAAQPTTPDLATALRLEDMVRSPLDALLRDAFSLDQTLEGNLETPTQEGLLKARDYADRMLASCRSLTRTINDFPRYTEQGYQAEEEPEAFELRRLIQRAFASVRDDLAGKELGLAWYISPHIGLHYKGDKNRLIYVLSLLLRDAVRATNHGMVCIRVRRAEFSNNPGHIQFTISDSGKMGPPLGRSSLMLARAWELAAANHGELTVNSTALGMEVSFGLSCLALEDDGQTMKDHAPDHLPDNGLPGPHNPSLVIVASNQPLNRQMLAYYLEQPGRVVWEARDAEEALALYTHTPGAAVIFDGALPEQDIVAVIAAIRAFEGEYALPHCGLLALSLDDVQGKRLLQAGCTSFLTQPVRRERYRALVQDLLSQPRPTALPKSTINLREARLDEEDGRKGSPDVKLDLSQPPLGDAPPFVPEAPKNARKMRFPWQKPEQGADLPPGVEPIVPLSYTVTPPPGVKNGQISPADLKSKAGKEFAPLKLNRPKNLIAPPPEIFSTGFVGEPIPLVKPAEPELPDLAPEPALEEHPDEATRPVVEVDSTQQMETRADLPDEDLMLDKVREVLAEDQTAPTVLESESESGPESRPEPEPEPELEPVSEPESKPVEDSAEDSAALALEEEIMPDDWEDDREQVEQTPKLAEEDEERAEAEMGEEPGLSEPDSNPEQKNERPLITTERTSHLHAQGFVLPAQPKKKKGWLGGLFKPVPKVSEQDQEQNATPAVSGAFPYGRDLDDLPLDPYTAPAFAQISEPMPVPKKANAQPELEIIEQAEQDESKPEPEVPLSLKPDQGALPGKPDKAKQKKAALTLDIAPKPEIAPLPSPLFESLRWIQEQAEQALRSKDSEALQEVAELIDEQAQAYGLRGLADLARYLAEASANHDFAAVSLILPDLQHEIERHKDL